MPTDDEIRHMRRRHRDEGVTVAALAREFGLSYMGAANIISRKTHKKVGIAKAPHSIMALHKDLYGIWTMMHVRCEDPGHISYKDYGGRGISVCPEWKEFEPFFKDMYPRPSMQHTLDRKNPDGNYTKDNVQWATKTEQSRNKRASLYLKHPATGIWVPAAEIAEYLGVSYQAMRARYMKQGLWKPLTAKEIPNE